MLKWLRKRKKVDGSVEERMEALEEAFAQIAEQWEDEYNRFRALYANRENQIKRLKQVEATQGGPPPAPPSHDPRQQTLPGVLSHKEAIDRQRRANGVLQG